MNRREAFHHSRVCHAHRRDRDLLLLVVLFIAIVVHHTHSPVHRGRCPVVGRRPVHRGLTPCLSGSVLLDAESANQAQKDKVIIYSITIWSELNGEKI
jgi:hypothetical protein